MSSPRSENSIIRPTRDELPPVSVLEGRTLYRLQSSWLGLLSESFYKQVRNTLGEKPIIDLGCGRLPDLNFRLIAPDNETKYLGVERNIDPYFLSPALKLGRRVTFWTSQNREAPPC